MSEVEKFQEVYNKLKEIQDLLYENKPNQNTLFAHQTVTKIIDNALYGTKDWLTYVKAIEKNSDTF